MVYLCLCVWHTNTVLVVHTVAQAVPLRSIANIVSYYSRWLVGVVGLKWFTPPSIKKLFPAPLVLNGRPSRKQRISTVKMPRTCVRKELPNTEHLIFCVHTCSVLLLSNSCSYYLIIVYLCLHGTDID